MRILCFGDSNTYGYDPRGYLADRYDEQSRWPELVAARTGWEVVNSGLCGREIPRTNQWLPSLSEYDCVLLMLGTNDLLQGATAKEAAETAETNAETAEANAKLAQTAAENAKTGAETAQGKANTSAANAATSEANAKASETNAAASAAAVEQGGWRSWTSAWFAAAPCRGR